MTFFDNAYEGVPTWDIGRPQGAVVRLVEAGDIEGAVIDIGCGTGENALFLAKRGHQVVGVDLAHAAIDRAVAKARGRQSPVAPGERPNPLAPGERPNPLAPGEQPGSVTFQVHDALELETLGRTFDTGLDVGCFHTLQPHDRRRYAASLRAVLRAGGRALLLCWSDRNPFGYGPERVTRPAIRAAFRDGWEVESIEPEILDTRLPAGEVQAWLARLRRT